MPTTEEKRAVVKAAGWVRQDRRNKEWWIPGGTWIGFQPLLMTLDSAYKRVMKEQRIEPPVNRFEHLVLLAGELARPACDYREVPDNEIEIGTHLEAIGWDGKMSILFFANGTCRSIGPSPD